MISFENRRYHEGIKIMMQKVKLRKLTKSELVRQAIRSYRESQHVGQELSLASLLEKTSGILTIKDGLEYQQKIRDEWEIKSFI